MPGLDLAAIARNDLLNMVCELALRFSGAGNLLRPGRHRAIPDERMTAHGHLIYVGKGQHLVGELEIELTTRRTEIVPEQAAFRRQLLAIGLDRDPILGFVLQRREIDAGAVWDAPARARRGSDRRGRRTAGKSSTRQRAGETRATQYCLSA
jgi:hypothetical protein